MTGRQGEVTYIGILLSPHPGEGAWCLGIWEKACQPKIRKVHQKFSTSVKFEVNTTWNSFQKLFWRCVFISIQALFVLSVSGYWKLSQARLSAGYQAFRSDWHPTSACFRAVQSLKHSQGRRWDVREMRCGKCTTLPGEEGGVLVDKVMLSTQTSALRWAASRWWIRLPEQVGCCHCRCLGL